MRWGPVSDITVASCHGISVIQLRRHQGISVDSNQLWDQSICQPEMCTRLEKSFDHDDISVKLPSIVFPSQNSDGTETSTTRASAATLRTISSNKHTFHTTENPDCGENLDDASSRKRKHQHQTCSESQDGSLTTSLPRRAFMMRKDGAVSVDLLMRKWDTTFQNLSVGTGVW